MALRCLRILRVIRTGNMIHRTLKSTAITIPEQIKINKVTQYKTEDNMVYLEDPDVFGTLSRNVRTNEDKFEDEGDIKEQEFLSNKPMNTQKLTIRQYADLIKQYISHKRLKEAIDVLEVRMLTEDRVKPDNYIYNILIGACADVGYTKKAFKLYNDMKRRALKPTGDTYTCLFHACANSPWDSDGLKRAHLLREFMKEKGVEPNLTNYNSMIKAFGRCGDLPTAFKIVDEMISKEIKIRVHTFNHLLQACISDKNTGLRHALVVWRKMLAVREKPNLYSFNLMLKCVKDCNLGTKADIEELIGILRESIAIGSSNTVLQIDDSGQQPAKYLNEYCEPPSVSSFNNLSNRADIKTESEPHVINDKLQTVNNSKITIMGINIPKKLPSAEERVVPNLLSKVIQMQQVLALQEVHTVQDKFAVIGGQEDFFREMKVYSVTPDVKIFTQMIPLIDNTLEAENKLLETIKSLGIKADIDFYNLLIKKRCMNSDYDGAFEVKDIIEQENKARKKRHPLKKKIRLHFNIMTYGVLALACRTGESAEKLLNEMKEHQLKVNIEILGTLLKNAAIQSNFEYVLYIMRVVKEEDLKVNDKFLKHLETFSDKCASKVQQRSQDNVSNCSNAFSKSYRNFSTYYKNWLKEVNIEDALKSEHPWQQFRENYPESFQRSNIVFKEPKRFFKRNRKYVNYTPRI